MSTRAGRWPFHLPEYLIEAAALGIFMVSAAGFTVLLFHPASPIVSLLPGEGLRRLLMGIAMGATLVALIYSPWGKRSGAHMNPAFTLAFYRLGKVHPRDAVWYMVFQFIGGFVGIALAALLLGASVAHPAVNYVVTVPGPAGAWTAFVAELVISFGLMLLVLTTTNHPRWSAYTGWCAGALVALYIFLESPISGMSMNPARTLGPDLEAGTWNALWVYFAAPVLGMLLATEAYTRWRGVAAVFCAKLQHDTTQRCIFCQYRARREAGTAS